MRYAVNPNPIDGGIDFNCKGINALKLLSYACAYK